MFILRLPIFFAGVVGCIGLVYICYDTPTLALKASNLKIITIAQASNDITTKTSLKVGDRGENIKKLQTRLKVLGYFSAEVNGIYDEKTKLAVSAFQKSQNLAIDGQASPSLQQRLEHLLFDHYMQNGYEATEKKEYILARENFQKAIDLKNNNLYAQKAIANIERYLKRINQQKKQQRELQTLFIFLTVVAVSLALFFFIQIFRRQQQLEEVVDFSERDDEQLDSFKVNNAVNQAQESQVKSKNAAKETTGIQLSSQVKPKSELSSKSTSNRLAKIDLVDELIDNLYTSEPNKRKKAIWELAQRADSRAMEPLVQVMIEADSQERSLILEALSQISNRTLRPVSRALAISLQDENPQVRVNGIRDLTRMYEQIVQINRQLYYAVNDPETEVQETAQWALEMLHQMQLPTDSNQFSKSQKK